MFKHVALLSSAAIPQDEMAHKILICTNTVFRFFLTNSRNIINVIMFISVNMINEQSIGGPYVTASHLLPHIYF